MMQLSDIAGPRLCYYCKNPIPEERIEALPRTHMCTPCARRNPEPKRHDPNVVCMKPSVACNNGFAPNDTGHGLDDD